MSSGSASSVAGFSVGSGSSLRGLRGHREHDAALVDRLDERGVGEPVAAGAGAHVHDHAVEHVGIGVGEHVLDLADLASVGREDGRAVGEDEVRGGVPEVHSARLPAPPRHNPWVPELEPGDEFAGCRIEAVAGRGGMGVVYRATELSLGRPVALKLLAPDRAGDREFRERFQREWRMAAAIDHPNVIPIYAAGEHDGSLYLVMRYVGGTDLHALLREQGRLEPERAAELVAQVASALDAAHAAGLVHRDVKPANVLLAGDHAYLSDFGLTRLAGSDAQLTESGQWIGTVEYCSPEQLQGERTDARADVYSLGCVLFAALCGKPPFSQGTVPATMLAHLHDPPPLPSVAGRAARVRPRDRARAGQAARGPLPVGRRPRPRRAGRRARRAGDRVRAQRGGRLGGAGARRQRRRDGRLRPEETAVTRWDTHEGMTALAPADDAASRRAAPTSRVAPPRPATATSSARAAGRPAWWWPAAPSSRWSRSGSCWGWSSATRTVGGADRPADRGGGPRRRPRVRRRLRGRGSGRAAGDARAQRGATAPGGASRGRDQVVDQYNRQFDGKVGGYELDIDEVQAGRGGRASGSYHVERDSGDPYDGSIVFGVVRERGEPRIALIAFTPSSS